MNLDPNLVNLSIFFGILTFLVSFVLTWVSLKLALKFNILDSASSNPDRKDQKDPVPLMGATGYVLIATIFTGFIWLLRKDYFSINFFDSHQIIAGLLGKNLEPFKLIWIILAIIILLVAGYFDDKHRFSSKVMILPVAVALFLTTYLGGLKIEILSYPFLNQFIPQNSIAPYFLSFVWIGLCLSATKFLDGHDGLVSTVGIISFLTIAATSMLVNVNQPFIFLICIIWAAGLAGFLPWNFPDAKVYLGEGGSMIIGFMIGVLSILSGAKVATSATIIGWFIYDIILVMILRVSMGKNPLEGDRLHWHFRLKDMGMDKIQVLIFTATVLIVSSILGLTLSTAYKPYLLISQAGFIFLIFVVSEILKRKNS